MDKVNLSLSIRQALERSLNFTGQFLKRHWLLSIIYIVIGVLPAFIIGDQDASELSISTRIQMGFVGLASIIPGLLIVYYGLTESLQNIEPGRLSGKSLLKSLWQIVCLNILCVIVSVPLFVLFIIPGIWWSVKSSTSYARLLSSDDGPIASIRKSHELMNDKFWRSFGFMFGTSCIVFCCLGIAAGAIGFFVVVGGLVNAFVHEGAGFNKIMVILRLIGPAGTLLSAIILYYIQAWLYTCLKLEQEKALPQI